MIHLPHPHLNTMQGMRSRGPASRACTKYTQEMQNRPARGGLSTHGVPLAQSREETRWRGIHQPPRPAVPESCLGGQLMAGGANRTLISQPPTSGGLITQMDSPGFN